MARDWASWRRTLVIAEAQERRVGVLLAVEGYLVSPHPAAPGWGRDRSPDRDIEVTDPKTGEVWALEVKASPEVRTHLPLETESHGRPSGIAGRSTHWAHVVGRQVWVGETPALLAFARDCYRRRNERGYEGVTFKPIGDPLPKAKGLIVPIRLFVKCPTFWCLDDGSGDVRVVDAAPRIGDPPAIPREAREGGGSPSGA